LRRSSAGLGEKPSVRGHREDGILKQTEKAVQTRVTELCDRQKDAVGRRHGFFPGGDPRPQPGGRGGGGDRPPGKPSCGRTLAGKSPVQKGPSPSCCDRATPRKALAARLSQGGRSSQETLSITLVGEKEGEPARTPPGDWRRGRRGIKPFQEDPRGPKKKQKKRGTEP